MESLWQAIAIIMAVSIVSLGIRAGAVVALSIPLTLAIVFPIMEMSGIDLQRISLGALIIALTLLVDDAMTTVDVMSKASRPATARSRRRPSPTVAGDPDADGFLRDRGRLRADRLRPQFRRRVHFLDLRGRAIALIVSWLVAVLFAPLLGVVLLKKPKTIEPAKPAWYSVFPVASLWVPCAHAGSRSASPWACSCCR